MRTGTTVMCATALVLVTAGGAAAQKGSQKPAPCKDPALEVTIVPITGSALGGDAKGSVYTNAVDRVIATINACGSAPTYDAVVAFGRATRSLGFTFPTPTDGSIINGPSPVWANGVTFLAKPFFNVRNILWGRMNGQSTFTTRLIFEYIMGPGDRSAYDLRFQPAIVDALQNAPPFPDTNLPSETSTATVQDIPGTCRTTPGGTLDSWIVTVDAPFVGTVHKEDGAPHTHSGQYTMPIQLLIKAKTCLPF